MLESMYPTADDAVANWSKPYFMPMPNTAGPPP